MRKLGPVIPIKYSGWKGLGNSGTTSYAPTYVVSSPSPTASYSDSTPTSHPEMTYVDPAYGTGLAPPPPSGPHARGLYPFTASSPQELSFQPGDVLRILSQDGAWWQAELAGAVGLVPSNYVELC